MKTVSLTRQERKRIVRLSKAIRKLQDDVNTRRKQEDSVQNELGHAAVTLERLVD